MSGSKFFRVLMALYIIIFCFIIGLIFNKFISHPAQQVSPAVSVSIEVSEKVKPEKLVHQIYDWIQLDSSRSKSIIADGIPTIENRMKGKSFMDLIFEPKHFFNYIVYWTAGVDFKRPVTYFNTSIPGLGSEGLVNKKAQKVSSKSEGKVVATLPSENRVIESSEGTIYLNVPEEELLQARKFNQPVEPEKKIKPDKDRDKPIVELTKRKPRVLIYHTHTSETYCDDTCPADATFHTFLPELGNITDVGAAMARELERLGVEVKHVTESFDGEDFSSAYYNAEKYISKVLKEESFDVVIDMHRDGAKKEWKVSYPQYVKEINDKKAARLLYIVTQGKLKFLSEKQQQKSHPNWERNFAFCAALTGKTQQMYPGLLKDVRKEAHKRYNQHLHPHAILVEVGYQGNTTEEAIYSGKLFARALADLLKEEPALLLD